MLTNYLNNNFSYMIVSSYGINNSIKTKRIQAELNSFPKDTKREKLSQIFIQQSIVSCIISTLTFNQTLAPFTSYVANCIDFYVYADVQDLSNKFYEKFSLENRITVLFLIAYPGFLLINYRFALIAECSKKIFDNIYSIRSACIVYSIKKGLSVKNANKSEKNSLVEVQNHLKSFLNNSIHLISLIVPSPRLHLISTLAQVLSNSQNLYETYHSYKKQPPEFKRMFKVNIATKLIQTSLLGFMGYRFAKQVFI